MLSPRGELFLGGGDSTLVLQQKTMGRMLVERGKTVSPSQLKPFIYHCEMKSYSGRMKPLLKNPHKKTDYSLKLNMGTNI